MQTFTKARVRNEVTRAELERILRHVNLEPCRRIVTVVGVGSLGRPCHHHLRLGRHLVHELFHLLLYPAANNILTDVVVDIVVIVLLPSLRR